jgi:hypothetical protein
LTWGSAALLLLPPIGLIAYAAHVTQIYVHPEASQFAIGFFATADYVAGTVAPYACPVVLAVGLHPKLRQTILTGAGPTPSSLTALPGRGSPAGK